ncbi:MAG: biotin/lipoate A/B protein ligase family protein [Pirellulaceae bacterium]
MDAYLIHDVPATGTWNMAMDEALVEWAGRTGGTCLRFYQWSPATLSLGYFQTITSRQSHSASRDIPLVRRASGGGAIIHDRELTYSLVFPVTHRFAPQAQSLVRRFHGSLIAVLETHGIQAGLCGSSHQLPREKEPFLCFLRRAPEDVLVSDHKVAGSAQRRHRGAVLQHGSILLDRSDFATELPGIAQAAGVDLSLAWLGSALRDELARRLKWQFRTWQPAGDLLDRAHWWETNRFATASWNHKRE